MKTENLIKIIDKEELSEYIFYKEKGLFHIIICEKFKLITDFEDYNICVTYYNIKNKQMLSMGDYLFKKVISNRHKLKIYKKKSPRLLHGRLSDIEINFNNYNKTLK